MGLAETHRDEMRRRGLGRRADVNFGYPISAFGTGRPTEEDKEFGNVVTGTVQEDMEDDQIRVLDQPEGYVGVYTEGGQQPSVLYALGEPSVPYGVFNPEAMQLQRKEDIGPLEAIKHEVEEVETPSEFPFPRESEGARAEILQALEEKRKPDPESYVGADVMGVPVEAQPIVQEGETVPEIDTQEIEV